MPFTFNFTLATNEHIVGASLAVSLLASGLSATNDLLYLDSVTNGFSFGSLGWLPISTAVSNPTVRVLDLSSQLNLLADGRLNLAVQNDVGIDWALLELQVAPNISAGTMSLTPAADATVRGGASANSNFGTATTLTTKEDSLADNDRKAFLRWDLSGVTGIVYQARVRLTPVGVGTNAIEQGAAFSTNHAWSENSITWNNQPFAGKRFATWIPGTNAPLEFVVTPQVLDALAGDKQLTLEIFSLRNFGAAGTVDYASRESSDPASRPQLLLVVSELPPTVSAFTNLSIPVNASTGPLPFSISDDKSAVTDLTVIGSSSNTNLVPTANVVFGGSGSNRTVTVTPASNQNGQTVITVTVTDTAGLSSSQSFTLTVSSHPPSLLIWNGPGPGPNPWSTALDWLPVASPETLDDVKFFDNGAAGVSVSNVNNFVDAAFGSAIASLQYGNTNGNHTTLIASGQDLTVANGLTVGTGTDNGNAQAVNTTITGPGASLTLAGGDCVVRQATDGASSGSQRATLNLSGLDVFDASVNRLVVGSEGPFARVTGTLFLARTNQIIAAGNSPSIAVGGAGGGSGNAGGSSFLYLGKNTALFADSLAVGRGKQGGTVGLSSSLRFNPAFTNSNPALGGTVFMRAPDGISRMTSWNLGDSGSGGGTVNTAGACDFTGGTVDARVNTIVVGKSSTGGGLGNPAGSLTLHAGTIDVNTLQLGYQSISGSNSASGLATLSGGTLQVNSTLELAHVSGGTGAANTSGTLNLNGGAAQINSIITGTGSGPTLVAINSATMILTNTAGSLAAPIGTLALTNANLQLFPGTNTPSLVTGNLVTGPGTTTITILSLPAFASYPAQLKLIQYSGAIAGAGFNFALGPLPDSPICGAYLSNNLGSVDLVITNCFVPDTFLTWDGSVDGTWDTKTANWKNNVGPGLVYSPGDSVVFNDAASGITDINLAETLTPAQVTVSNNLKAYAFVDLGKISGAGNLVKQGPGTLILANESANDFTGGTTISGGELRVGDGVTNGALPDGAV
ncbi:MAG TPA: DNRLRE domain-containing protein, partial [Methylomirabilota bacterium]|nr:DNRLRE domain-containing protein [Methylomirabilota bacterium]